MADDIRGELAKLYLAFFNRAPDPEGLAFWESEYLAAAGSLDFTDILNNIANSFAISDEALSLYPGLDPDVPTDIGAFLTDAYMNLFARAPDVGGLAYWTGRVQEELLAGRPVGSILVDIQSGAQDTGAGLDRATLINKVDVGLSYADAFEASGAEWTPEDDLAGSKAVVEDVDGTSSSVVEAGGKIDDVIEGQTEPEPDPTPDPGPGPDPDPTHETFADEHEFEDLVLGSDGGELFAGTGNPTTGFAVTTIRGDQGTTIELGLDARYTADLTDLPGTIDGFGVGHFDIDAGTAARFAYSVATDGADLSDFKFVLRIDPNPIADDSGFIDFTLKPGSSPSGYIWDRDGVDGDVGIDILDDEGSASVTQNIQSLAWYDELSGSSLAAGEYEVVLQAYTADGLTLLGQNTVEFNVLPIVV